MLLLCLHHVEEMVNHDNEAVAARRLRFLANLPFLAWVGSSPDRSPGTVVTLWAQEISAAYASANATAQEVRVLAKPQLIQSGSGLDLLGADAEGWLALRPLFAAQAEQARKVVAFGHLNIVDIAHKPVAELLGGKLRAGVDLQRQLKLMTGTFARHVRDKGDRRIADPDAWATEFMQDVEGMAVPAPSTAAELVLRSLALQRRTFGRPQP